MSGIIERGRRTEDQQPRLEEGIDQLMELAARLGLDPFAIDFEIVPASAMHSFAAYGLPERYSHWTFGRAFRQQKTMYDYGLSRIYEMVVNSDPSQAFLLDNNPVIANLMVAAHVIGHVDYFKHNYLFELTTRDMPLLASQRAERIRGYELTFGEKRVETFLDAALTLTGHIDASVHHRPVKNELLADWKKEVEARKSKPKDEFDGLNFQKRPEVPTLGKKVPVPLHPDRDILGFLRDFSDDLENWQRDILDIVREESYYFLPQMRTKICNEGYAVLVHKILMHEMEKCGHLTDEEAEAWWRLHSGVARPHEKDLNPYWFGMMMWQWLADYYNGQVDAEEAKWLRDNNWPLYEPYTGPIFGSPGMKKVREIMMVNDDVSLVRNYFNYIPARRMFAYLHETFDYGDDPLTFISTTEWVEVKEGILQMLTNYQPLIEIVAADYGGHKELLLRHNHEGLDLEVKYIEKTLPYIWRIWGYPVHLLAEIDEMLYKFSCEGIEVTRTDPEGEEYEWAYEDDPNRLLNP